MTFWDLFFRLLPRDPVRALPALYWHLTRRRVRARSRLIAAVGDYPFAYELWVRMVENSSGRAAEFREAIKAWSFTPRFSLLLYSPAGASADDANRSISSVERQIYPNWSLTPVESGSMRSAVSSADGEFLVFLRAGDMLAEAALFRFAEALQANRAVALLYGDEDQLDRRSRRTRPWFKPRWNTELFLAHDYLTNTAAVETSLARKIMRRNHPGSPAKLISAAALSSTSNIVHVPHIVCHVSATAKDQPDRLADIGRLVEPLGATCSRGPFGTVRIEWPLPPELPLVSIIVPTRDKLELLKPCIESVLGLTTYGKFEILIIDNGSRERRTTDYLREIAKDPRVRMLAYPGSYNFSAINNFAVREARGAYLCLLNNDTEVLGPAWLTEMMRHATRPNIGAVGAKLLYEDGTIQHAGVVVGIGEAAGHAHRFLPANEPGYFLMPHVTQFISAVTAACLVIEKKKFQAVGGLDEAELAVAFNDVDLCLKLEKMGWRNVYVPHAILTHHESKSRGADVSPLNIDRYRRELTVLQERWGTKTYLDPLHNPNLDRYNETYVIGF